MCMKNVAALIVTYADRWIYLSQVLEALEKDVYITDIVIVDNASKSNSNISDYKKASKKNIHIITNEKNLGSAGGFKQGLETIRNLNVDYVFILDDDNVPQDGAVDKFFNIQKMFLDSSHVVLGGNRYRLGSNDSIFSSSSVLKFKNKKTFYNVLSLQKIVAKIVRVFFKEKYSYPLLPVESLAYGGTFASISAIIETKLPDEKLFVYGDDIEYSWNMADAGYVFYSCKDVLIDDVDNSFSDNSHLTGLFLASTSDLKVYFRIRNAVLISRKYAKGIAIISLFINVILWTKLLFLYALLKVGPNRTFFKRVALITRASYNGWKQNYEY